MRHEGTYLGRDVFGIERREYDRKYCAGKLDGSCFYWLCDENYYMILDGEIIGTMLGYSVSRLNGSIKYVPKYQIPKKKPRAKTNSEHEEPVSNVKEEEGLAVPQINFKDYSKIVDQFFENLQ